MLQIPWAVQIPTCKADKSPSRRSLLNPQTGASTAWEAGDKMDIKGNSLLFVPAPVSKFLFIKQELYERERAEPGFAEGS